MCHVTHMCVMNDMDEAWRTFRTHVAHMHKSCRTYQCVTSHIWMRRLTDTGWRRRRGYLKLQVSFRTRATHYRALLVYLSWTIWCREIQGGEDEEDASSCRSFFTKETLIIGLFCRKWPMTFEKRCTGWRRRRGCLKLQVIFRKRATNCRALLREFTYESYSYESGVSQIRSMSHFGIWIGHVTHTNEFYHK